MSFWEANAFAAFHPGYTAAKLSIICMGFHRNNGIDVGTDRSLLKWESNTSRLETIINNELIVWSDELEDQWRHVIDRG